MSANAPDGPVTHADLITAAAAVAADCRLPEAIAARLRHLAEQLRRGGPNARVAVVEPLTP